ncbi:MAG: restriction endonuclease subunit S [Gammaproteobacteria bacterium]|nr:restriction endonuclease subunit S [Gammaproteobacteria bacterium]
MADRLHLQPRHRRMLESLLQEHLPEVEVWAYGSRVTGRSHEGSDLDLVLRGPGLGKIPVGQLADFEEAVRESNIPFLVEARDWARLPERFHSEIQSRYVTFVEAPDLNAKWRTVRLGDHIDSCLGKMLDKKKNRGELLPYLGNKNVRWGSFDTSDLGLMRFEDHELSRYGLEYGDLVVCEGGEPGRCAIWRDEVPGMKIQKALHRIRAKGQLNNRYLYYWFLLSGRRGALDPYFTGTTIKHLTAISLNDLQVLLPSKPEQDAIAHILGTLDDKIELNRRMNETLEAIARALFKSWFVDFELVRAKMAQVESRDIPIGWRTGTLAELAVARRQNAAPADCGDETPYIGLEHMPRRSIALESWGSAEGVKSAKSRFEKGDILFGKLRPYFHKVGIAPVEGVCSTDIVVIAPKSPEWSAFVSAAVSSDPFISYTDQTSTGTRMPRTSWKTMGQYPICIPPDQLALAYQEAMQPILARIVANIHLSHTLAQIRDILLPKLISGEISIADAETAVEAVA